MTAGEAIRAAALALAASSDTARLDAEVLMAHAFGVSRSDLLLRHMLRAARLHQGAQVWMAPLQRSAGAAEVSGLDAVLGRTEPDVVFVMSRLAAQALLETDQPLGRLRGQVHDLWGVPAVVSYDLGALLRMPQEKAKAWDDLCLALQVAQAQHAERRDAG